jgi:hypothetical protein
MKFLSPDEIREFCIGHGLQFDEYSHLHYSAEPDLAFAFKVHEHSAPRTIGLAYWLTNPAEGKDFGGGLFWTQGRWGCHPHWENVATAMFNKMRHGDREQSEHDDRPGVLFDTTEFYDMHAYVSVPLLFDCTDSYVVLPSEDFFIYISDDEFISVVCRNQTIYDRMFELVKQWNPRDLKDLWTK